MHKSITVCLFAVVTAFATDLRAVTIAWSPVGNPGNAADSTGYGAVAYNYNIGTYDVTNSQYVEFLNAKDPTGADPLGLYNGNMSNAALPYYGGINYNANNTNGSKYSVISGDGNHPVDNVSWYDTLRFANWLNNGQGNGDTETGAYTLLGGTPTPSNAINITRNAGATIFLPSVNEWYKAAYYNPTASSYYQYPTSSNTIPTASGPTATPNSANYNEAVNNLTDVGAYTGTTSPYGAYDMGGNVIQWNEALIDNFARGTRGDAWGYPSNYMLSSFQFPNNPFNGNGTIGFRVAGVPTGFIPEPSTGVLAFIAFAMMCWRRWKVE